MLFSFPVNQFYSQTGCSLAIEQHCNIVPQYCHFDREIALSNLQPTQLNKLQVEIHKGLICKQSL
jgi:hypothetical protein